MAEEIGLPATGEAHGKPGYMKPTRHSGWMWGGSVSILGSCLSSFLLL